MNDLAQHLEILKKLQDHYGGQVCWTQKIKGKRTEVPEPYRWAVEYQIDEVQWKIFARTVSCSKTKTRGEAEWVSLGNITGIKKQISDIMHDYANKPIRETGKGTYEPTRQGKILLKELRADFRGSFNPNYLEVLIPESPTLPYWQGFLTFDFAKENNKSPRRRSWKEKNLRMLLARMEYAWIVTLDFNTQRAKLYYAGFVVVHKATSGWFSWHDLHFELTQITARADDGNWKNLDCIRLNQIDALIALREANGQKLSFKDARDMNFEAVSTKQIKEVVEPEVVEPKPVIIRKQEEIKPHDDKLKVSLDFRDTGSRAVKD